jgi:hypothetical protein
VICAIDDAPQNKSKIKTKGLKRIILVRTKIW